MGVGIGYYVYARAPRREVERVRHALAQAKSWHVHYVDEFPDSTEEFTIEVICPSFLRRQSVRTNLQTGQQQPYQDVALDGVQYFTYPQISGWRNNPKPILNNLKDCSTGPLVEYGAFLPLDAYLRDGEVERGELHDIAGLECRDYVLIYPTPGQLRPDIRATLCIDEKQHLPLEVRRPVAGLKREMVTTFTEWNKAITPDIPPEVPLGR